MSSTDAFLAFCEERLDEWEARALAAQPEWQDEWALSEWNDLPDASFALARTSGPDFALAAVAALRAILAWHAKQCTCTWVDDEGDDLPQEDMTGHGCPTLLKVASIWSDHPGYEEAVKG